MAASNKPSRPLPLLSGNGNRPVIRRPQCTVSARVFLAQARILAEALPSAPNLVNLCEDRGHFLLGFAASLIGQHRILLPPSRAPRVVEEIVQAYRPAAIIDDALVAVATASVVDASTFQPPLVDPDRIVAIGFTSGSTGTPKANSKTWRAFSAGTLLNRDALGRYLSSPFNVLATVPSQHMYGMETCVLLPLLADASVSIERPLFPADLMHALNALPRPRVLVTTPVHLRVFVNAELDYPQPDLIVSATAPLSPELAQAAERLFRCPLLEVFGSTETCVIAQRRTAAEPYWRLYSGLRLEPVAEGTRLHAPHYEQPVLLHDHVCLLDGDRFAVEGRCQDMVEIGGKRASLGDIAQRLLAISGVDDAAVIQCADRGGGVQRLLAFVVAPGLDDAGIFASLRSCLDPAFVPRRLIRVERLPRNEAGKLRRDDLLGLLGRT